MPAVSGFMGEVRRLRGACGSDIRLRRVISPCGRLRWRCAPDWIFVGAGGKAGAGAGGAEVPGGLVGAPKTFPHRGKVYCAPGGARKPAACGGTDCHTSVRAGSQ